MLSRDQAHRQKGPSDAITDGNEAPLPSASGGKRLASLDGLRGLSILIVLLGHGASTADSPAALEPMRNLGIVGVDVFFGISGFIITLLLFRERLRAGCLSLPRFWMRRALRILPPLTIVCCGFWLAGRAGVMHWSWPSFAGAVTFTKDVPLFGGDWFFGHFWSLSVEEQFYLLWPLVLIVANERMLLRGLGLLLALSPALALLCVDYLPVLQNLLPFLPYLGTGCLVAIASQLPAARAIVFFPGKPVRLFLLLALPATAIMIAYWHREGVVTSVSVPGEGLLLPAAVLIALIESVREDGLLKGLLTCRPLVWLGTVSYSVYLWQQLFMGPPAVYESRWFWSAWPQNVFASVACGIFGYWLVERPVGRLKTAIAGSI